MTLKDDLAPCIGEDMDGTEKQKQIQKKHVTQKNRFIGVNDSLK